MLIDGFVVQPVDVEAGHAQAALQPSEAGVSDGDADRAAAAHAADVADGHLAGSLDAHHVRFIPYNQMCDFRAAFSRFPLFRFRHCRVFFL